MIYEIPELDKEAFHCPRCNVYSHQSWYEGALWGSNGLEYFEDTMQELLKISCCIYCKGYSYWINDKMLYPDCINAPHPNEDLDAEIQSDYLEAASIVNKSPRGAAALLRLALQKLCKQLGESGENINEDIGNLVENGLPVEMQRALDIVRVVGNESVHPGEMDIKDDKEIAITLFKLVNKIAQHMITDPKDMNEFYSTLPEKKLDGIKNRDMKSE